MTAPVGLDITDRIVKPHVAARITIHPQPDDAVYTDRRQGVRVIGSDPKTADAALLSLSWDKALGAASGHWSATIKIDRHQALDINAGDILDGDWAEVDVWRNGWRFPLAIGPVDAVSVQTISVDGATAQAITLSGRDHGAPFEGMIAWQNYHVETLPELTAGVFANRLSYKTDGSPSEMFGAIIRGAFAKGDGGVNHAHWVLPTTLGQPRKAKAFLDALTVQSEVTRGRLGTALQLWSQPGESVYSTLQAWCNPLLNEILCELSYDPAQNAKGQALLVAKIRERPFVTLAQAMGSPWFKLATVDVPRRWVQTTELHRSGQERFNIVELMVDLPGTQTDQQAMAPPKWDPLAVQTHGIKPHLESTRYIGYDSKDVANWTAQRAEQQQLLTDWYAPNPYLWSGSVGLGLALPELRPGQRLRIVGEDEPRTLTCYVEAVQSQWSWSLQGPSERTTAVVTRGVWGPESRALDVVSKVSGRFVAVFGASPGRQTVAAPGGG